jgi:hypothetical protein
MKFVGIDFDGSCVTHEYPKIGKDIGAQRVLKRVIDSKNKLILHTMRSGMELYQAQMWFGENELELYATNYNPSQASWTKSTKPYCHIYIDDAAAGCPLVRPEGERPYIDWGRIEQILIEEGFINDTGISTTAGL